MTASAPPPRHEIPTRSLVALVEAAATAIEAAGQPPLAVAYVGDQFPHGSHSFVMGSVVPYQLPDFLDGPTADPDVVRSTRFRLTVARLRQPDYLQERSCSPTEWLGALPTCEEPLPKLPVDVCDPNTEAPATVEGTVDQVTVAAAAIQATVDRDVLLGRGLKQAWCTNLRACSIYGGKTLTLETYEQFEEGRFIGSRIEMSARLG